MASSRRFWLGMIVGALAGGAISLLDRETRQAVKGDIKKASGTVTYIAKHPNEFIEEVQDTVNKVRSTVEQVTEDVAFITEKVEEIKDVPPQVAEIVQESKEAFSHLTTEKGSV
jgi:uncharacterized protein YoxC